MGILGIFANGNFVDKSSTNHNFEPKSDDKKKFFLNFVGNFDDSNIITFDGKFGRLFLLISSKLRSRPDRLLLLRRTKHAPASADCNPATPERGQDMRGLIVRA